MKKTWTDDPITPESYPPQANALIGNWFVSAAESWQNKLKMEWMGSGGAMNFTCLATISSSAGDVGMAAAIATDPETEYTVTFNTDNGNAGTLTARIIHYNNSSHTTYTLLREISVSRSSQNHISFTATADSVWLWVGHKANGTNLAAGTNFKVTSGSMLRYTWSVAQSHIQSSLYNYGAYRFAYNGIERTDEKAGKGNYYTALHGEYDPRTTKRDNVDPKPTLGISPYAMFRSNPILYNDVLLDTTYRFSDKDGTYLGRADLDQKGIKGSTGIYKTVKGKDGNESQVWEGSDFGFNDPPVDKTALENLKKGERGLIKVSDENMNAMLKNSDVFKQNFFTKWHYAFKESTGGKMDFSASYLFSAFPDAYYLSDNKTGFVLFPDNNPYRAFNVMDAGNYMWGNAMSEMGFDYSSAQFSSELNENFHDSPADQRAIGLGFFHVRKTEVVKPHPLITMPLYNKK